MISPCIGICKVEKDICIGCGRTTTEISEWRSATDNQKEKMLTESIARLNDDEFKVWVNKYYAKVKRLT